MVPNSNGGVLNLVLYNTTRSMCSLIDETKRSMLKPQEKLNSGIFVIVSAVNLPLMNNLSPICQHVLNNITYTL